ncbi:MAG: two-component system response regulator, partial [Proteobacteria bacterium]|nr:two-component system response regulator [Pseudomonadota bacterium]
LEARIVAIADCYDALRNSRIYKPNYDHQGAFRIITEGDIRVEPAHFDPKILEIFKRLAPRFEEMYKKMTDKK